MPDVIGCLQREISPGNGAISILPIFAGALPLRNQAFSEPSYLVSHHGTFLITLIGSMGSLQKEDQHERDDGEAGRDPVSALNAVVGGVCAG